ncbi:phage tail sheath family protein [Paenibacillus sp. N1-5-1-14]|uniref:phage tail sheath family protein n=1 Tax=Paenibacillus radicibacter TaxID=2972488 RepID=UPI00215939D3|nr:phage tail sheath family protein [Paenibacillus radicibacter]MCR8645564.1 phage tail sheath family protein [Paenibacillus radicibacter]
MAGGTWETQNKVRPGVYINAISEPKPLGAVGERGVVTMAVPLSWGEVKKVVSLTATDNFQQILGFNLTDPQLVLLNQALKRAQTVLLYRLNEGTKATVTSGSATFTARYSGTRGNDITMVVRKNMDQSDKWDVQTLVSGEVMDVQTVSNASDIKSNGWVVCSGELAATAGTPLVGGTDGTVTNQDHTDYLSAIEVHNFNVMALTSTDQTLKSVYVNFTKRLRDVEGRKIQLVLENYPQANHEGVISVKNGVILSNGTKLAAHECVAWVSGTTAGASVNQSLTYQVYDEAVDVSPKYTNAQIEAALRAGEFVFTQIKGRAVVEQDINTLTSYTPKKNKTFSKNRALRALDGLANDFKRIFEDYYIGKVDNNPDGRNLFKKECINQVELYQGMNAIQDFNSQTDVVVMEGEEIDGIYVELAAKPVDSIEKIYMKVRVK